MKYCANCHRMSRDDDFCSHCGSAVYGDNSENSIDCTTIKGHEHEHDRDIQKYAQLSQSAPAPRNNDQGKPAAQGKGCAILFVIIFLLLFLSPLFSLFAELFEMLS